MQYYFILNKYIFMSIYFLDLTYFFQSSVTFINSEFKKTTKDPLYSAFPIKYANKEYIWMIPSFSWIPKTAPAYSKFGLKGEIFSKNLFLISSDIFALIKYILPKYSLLYL